MARIRYKKTNQEGLFESVKRYQHPTNGARYKVLLDTKDHKWMVVDDMSDLVAASGLKVHKHKMKIDARRALEQLGVLLKVDSRKKKKVETV